MRRHLSYANVMATLAVLLAVAGGSTAIALTAGKNSVRSTSIKNGQVSGPDLAPSRVRSSSVPLSDAVADGNATAATATASCRRGERLVGGGFNAGGSGPPRTSVTLSQPGGRNAWIVAAQTDGFSTTLTAIAFCIAAKPGR